MYMYSANILLDHFMTAKLADFGFSIELPHVSSGKTVFLHHALPGLRDISLLRSPRDTSQIDPMCTVLEWYVMTFRLMCIM